jgi:hypothetical protein
VPVSKHRSVEDMPRLPRVCAEDVVAHIRAVWNRAFRICPPNPPRGVTRFTSIESANEARSRATIDRMRSTTTRPR